MGFDVSRLLHEAAENLQAISRGPYPAAVEQALNLLEGSLRAGSTLLVFGNGGSAADAQHLCAELAGRFLVERRPLPAIALTTNQALLTASSNDYRFDDVFARQIEGLGRPGDLVWGISTSGNSANIVNGLRRALERGLKTIGLTGAGGGQVAEYCDVLMAVPLTHTPPIQEVHLVTCHAHLRRLRAAPVRTAVRTVKTCRRSWLRRH
jgi:D-sedoheptulose 7-phosphate isomerase